MSKPAIALPISQHFNAVFPKLVDIIDYLLLRDVDLLPYNLIKSSYRKVYHTNGFINVQFAEEMTEDFIMSLNGIGICHMSFDLGPSCLDVCFNSEKNDIYWPANSCSTLKPNKIIDVAKDRIKVIKRYFSGTIALENLDYHQGGAYEFVCYPDFITEAVRELNVFFAIDIAHVLVTSYNLGIEPIKYIAYLPLELVREIHLSQPKEGNDRHDCPTKYEYDLLEYVLENSSPEFVVLEYYRNPQKIIDENIKLAKFLNK